MFLITHFTLTIIDSFFSKMSIGEEQNNAKNLEAVKIVRVNSRVHPSANSFRGDPAIIAARVFLWNAIAPPPIFVRRLVPHDLVPRRALIRSWTFPHPAKPRRDSDIFGVNPLSLSRSHLPGLVLAARTRGRRAGWVAAWRATPGLSRSSAINGGTTRLGDAAPCHVSAIAHATSNEAIMRARLPFPAGVTETPRAKVPSRAHRPTRGLARHAEPDNHIYAAYYLTGATAK